MSLKKSVEAALSEPMSRREFLAKSAALALTVAGVSAVIKGLVNETAPHQADSYGSSAYGGAAGPNQRRV